MIGERNVLINFSVLRAIKCRPTSIIILHGQHPLHTAHGRRFIRWATNALQRHGHHRGVIHIWIPRVGILKKPSRWRSGWLGIFSPISAKSALFGAQPIARVLSGRIGHGEAAISEGVQRNARVPHRTKARLNSNAIVLLNKKFVQFFFRANHHGVAATNAQRVKDNLDIHHWWKDCAKTACRCRQILPTANSAPTKRRGNSALAPVGSKHCVRQFHGAISGVKKYPPTQRHILAHF